MSCFMVSKAHIDALLITAILGPSDAREFVRFGQWHVWYAPLGQHVAYENAGLIGTKLINENLCSFLCRYPQCATDPNSIADTDKQHWLRPYTLPANAQPLDIVTALKAIDCYEYQACEHDEWAASDAAKFTDRLRKELIRALPGYQAAPWGID